MPDKVKILLDDVCARVEDLSKQESFSNADFLEAVDLIRKLRVCGGAACELNKLGSKIFSLWNSELSRRTAKNKERHETLLQRALNGEILSEEEDIELRKTTEMLSWEH